MLDIINTNKGETASMPGNKTVQNSAAGGAGSDHGRGGSGCEKYATVEGTKIVVEIVLCSNNTTPDTDVKEYSGMDGAKKGVATLQNFTQGISAGTTSVRYDIIKASQDDSGDSLKGYGFSTLNSFQSLQDVDQDFIPVISRGTRKGRRGVASKVGLFHLYFNDWVLEC